VLALSGGVGGAKLVLGLSRVLEPRHLVIGANTADDFSHFGLRVCPDLDTVMYTLAGINDRQRGWGLAGESWQFMQSLKRLGGADWFNLGDRDLATHVLRTDSLARGLSLTQITDDFCRRLDVGQRLLPMSDDPVATLLDTDEGTLAFQDYFVRRRCQPVVSGYRFAGAESARPQPELLALLDAPDLAGVVICPSNPFLSVEPILALPGMRVALQQCKAPVIAVSPIVGGNALKGPAAKMMRELQQPASASQVARVYRGLVDGMVVDSRDASEAAAIESLGMQCLVTPTVMKTLQDKSRLAQRLVSWLQDDLSGT
jgi:LPPG:FO 2-phospho-L-lactate transferase